MKNRNGILQFTLLLIGTILSGYFGPWWAPSLVIILMTALLHLSEKQGLLFGALSLGLTFLSVALISNAADETAIISKVGAMLGGLSPVGMIGATTVLGIITGLLSGWVGAVIGVFIKKSFNSN